MKRKSQKHTPKISVVMPVYNAGRFLHQSIQSILDQTFENFEFIIVNDASTDNSASIINEYAENDPRIKVISHDVNLGISHSVKEAMDIAKGAYVARMDADDISDPKRLEKQYSHLEKNKELVAVGAQCTTIDENGKTIGKKSFPLTHKEIYEYIFRFIPMQQPTMMIARHRLPKHFTFYNDSFRTAEEVELMFKLFTYGKLENLPDTLLKYRIHSTNTSFKSVKKTFLNTLLSRIQAVYEYGYKPTASGVLYTLLQTAVVLSFPEPVIMFIYSTMRSIKHYSGRHAHVLKRWSLALAR